MSSQPELSYILMRFISNGIVPFFVVVSHVLLVVAFISIIYKKEFARFLGRHATLLAFLVSLAAVLGSLFYSEIIGFEPCPLCWWQRIFLYPLAVIFAVALWKKRTDVFSYAVPLALLALVVAGYHSYFELGGTSLIPCTAEGGACSRVYVKAFGYITIPVMSLTVSLFILMLWWANNVYRRNQPSF